MTAKVQQMMQVAQAFQQVQGSHPGMGTENGLGNGARPERDVCGRTTTTDDARRQQPQLPGSPPQPQTNLDVLPAVMQPNSAAPLQQGQY